MRVRVPLEHPLRMTSEWTAAAPISPMVMKSLAAAVAGGAGTSQQRVVDQKNSSSVDMVLDAAGGQSAVTNRQRLKKGPHIDEDQRAAGAGSGSRSSCSNGTTVTAVNDCSARKESSNNLTHPYPYIWNRLGSRPQRRRYRQLLIASTVLWIGWLACSSLQQTSRRLANPAYVLLSLAMSFTMILMLAFVDTVADRAGLPAHLLEEGAADPPHIPVRSLECLNAAQLQVFLIANVLTGVVNMSMQTIYASNATAFAVLCVYSSAVLSAAWLIGGSAQT
jgi:GWT1